MCGIRANVSFSVIIRMADFEGAWGELDWEEEGVKEETEVIICITLVRNKHDQFAMLIYLLRSF